LITERNLALTKRNSSWLITDEIAKKFLLDATREASLTKEDLADIINAGVEELLRLRFELPAFSTIHRTAQYAKTQVNKQIYGQVTTH
jgi:hypothetical protein